MKQSAVIEALGALAQETRLDIFVCWCRRGRKVCQPARSARDWGNRRRRCHFI
jgi:hypothetical protein